MLDIKIEMAVLGGEAGGGIGRVNIGCEVEAYGSMQAEQAEMALWLEVELVVSEKVWEGQLWLGSASQRKAQTEQKAN